MVVGKTVHMYHNTYLPEKWHNLNYNHCYKGIVVMIQKVLIFNTILKI